MQRGAILTLVRHGETSANLDGVWHGSTDTKLTERGQAQAERVGERAIERYADAVRIYTSPLQRARNTGEAIERALGCPLEVDEDLREYDLGSWEGRTYRELQEVEAFWSHIRDDPHFAPHGGETPLAVATRLTGALERLSHRHPGERIFIVTHGGALSMALGSILDGDYSQWRRVMSNCAVTELVVHPAPELLSFNETDHLDGV
jgi:broad specificity phosphatase PhoE